MVKIIAAAALLAVALPGIAQAQESRPDVHVSYHDLDLRRAGDVRILDQRLRKAIGAVCPDRLSADRFSQIAAARCQRAKWLEVAGLRADAIARAAARGAQVASAR